MPGSVASIDVGAGSNPELLNNTKAALEMHPECRDDFFSLQAAVSESASDAIANLDINDTTRLCAIISANYFEVPLELCTDVKFNAEGYRENDDYAARENRLRRLNATKGTGVFLKESFFNHSCTPNVIWETCGDHIFMFATRAVEAGEELCISYVPWECSYMDRTERFKLWVSSNDGFECCCDRCELLRRRADLRDMAIEVDCAFERSAKLVTQDGIPMSQAADSTLSPRRRKEIIEAHAGLPLKLQHRTVQICLIMEGASLAENPEKTLETLQCYETVADLGYAGQGGGPKINRMKDLWRIVGTALRCRDRDRASQVLDECWNKCCLPYDISCDDFQHLTERYACPYWRENTDDDNDDKRLMALSYLAKEATKNAGGS